MNAETRERLRLTRGWLLQRPRASSLRLTIGGEVRTVAFQPSQSWSSVASTVVAMGPDMLEALDAAGNVIRATDARFPEEDVDDELEHEPATRTTPAPPPDLVVPNDPESQRFALVARLLSDAYRHSTDVAFERLAAIAESQERRAASLERTVDAIYRVERQRLERHARELEEREDELDEDEPAGGKPDAVQTIVENIAKHFSEAGGEGGDETEAPAAPNGKAAH